MKAKGLIRIDFRTERQLETAFSALFPETATSVLTRSKLYLEKDGTHLVLKVEASDTIALRAALNAYLRWINSLKNVLLLLENSR